VTFVTTWRPVEALRRGLEAEPVPRSAQRGRLFLGRRRERLRAAYASPESVDALYRAWLERVQRHPGARHVLFRDDPGRRLADETPAAVEASARGPTPRR